ncbi:MoxR family ATPase, partial [Methanococcoides sp. SA1]|nr:MoxR family ATPase [Methanococcoides sp. SA1]
QFTPDLMPSDVLGYSIYNRDKGTMEFTKGPLQNHIVLADEINRPSPKTQSCLLEAMEERQITVDGKTYPIEAPFLVIATQNPFEFEGTFPLPEAQLDRFLMKLSIGYPDTLEDELKVALGQHKLKSLQSFIKQKDLIDLREKVRAVHIDETISKYIGELVRKTREDDRILLGASPRGTIALHQVAQAEAYLQERDYVVPEDVITHVKEILAHRMLLKPETRYKGVSHEEVIQSIIKSLSFPQKNTNA